MKYLRPNFMVEDVAATVAWYSDVFGAETLATVPETGDLDFALVRIGEVELMFEKAASLSEGIPALQNIPIRSSIVLYIDVADVEGLYARLKDKVETVKELYDTFYGTREFYMQDCNGYVLTLAQKK